MLEIIVDPDEPQIFPPVVFNEAIALAQSILPLDHVRDVFMSYAQKDLNLDRYNDAIKGRYLLKLMRKRTVLDAFSSIHPPDISSIYFNPILLVNMERQLNQKRRTEEAENGGAKKRKGKPAKTAAIKKAKPSEKQAGIAIDEPTTSDPFPSLTHNQLLKSYVYLIAVKILHQLFNLVHHHCSVEAALDRTRLKELQDVLVSGKVQPTYYNDLGTMMERHLFGGLWEATAVPEEVRKHSLQPDSVVIYPSIHTHAGWYLDVDNTVLSAERIIVPRTGGVYVTMPPRLYRLKMGRANQCKGHQAGCYGEMGQEESEQEDEEEYVGKFAVF